MIAPRSRSRFGRAFSAWPLAWQYGAALVIVLATTALIAFVNSGWGILDRVTIENPGTLYIAAVTVVALLIGVGPALMATAASMLAVFLTFHRYESVGRVVILVATILVIIGLAERQHRAQVAAERAQAKFEAILEGMSDAVMVVDVTGRSTDVNHAAVAMLGATDRADALAKITYRHADGRSATDEYALLERALAGEETAQRDVPIPDAPGGPRVVSAVASPLRDAHGQIIGAVSVSRDLTDRLAQAREREALLRRIEQEQQFIAQVLANVPVGIAVLRADDFTV
ncbi:MAG: PAS domain-containing protein, partial [Thermomicrobiales bacterium]